MKTELELRLVFMKNVVMSLLMACITPAAAAVAAFSHFVGKYIFSDWQFAAFMVTLIAIDTFVSMVRHFQQRTVSSWGFAKLFLKVIVYACFLITIHVLTNFTVNGRREMFFTWIDDFAYSAILVREVISILENITLLYPGLIPGWIVKRLERFNQEDPLNDKH